MLFTTFLVNVAVVTASAGATGFFQGEYLPFFEPINTVVKSPEPYTYIDIASLPTSFDWRNVNNTNYCSKVLNQKNPSVCGSCWAQAATGALTDRYRIATDNKLDIQLAPQNLLNFHMRTTGGTCEGGDHLKAYDFINKYGISDDNCMPYAGLNWRHGFRVSALTEVEDVRNHQCHTCSWDGNCGFFPSDMYNLYGADEFGFVRGENDMMAEIYARGPVACSLNSHPDAFHHYKGGVITCDKLGVNGEECRGMLTHLVVITGWGVESETGIPYWVGRNSYGTQWGEGPGGGWFRLERGKNTLQIESGLCAWAVPAKTDVDRVLKQYQESVVVV